MDHSATLWFNAFLAGAEPTSAANELAEGREVTNAQG